MTCAVIWQARADAKLIELWDQVADSEALADAADAVDSILSTSPYDQGESRESPARRLWFHPPLNVLFEVDDAAATVFVADIKWFRG